MWWRRRFREIGYNYEQALILDKLYHPNRNRTHDDVLSLLTRKEMVERQQRKIDLFGKVTMQNRDDIHNGVFQTEEMFYDYSELHPDDYIVPEYIRVIRSPQSRPIDYSSNISIPFRLFCYCDKNTNCKCNMRNSKAPLGYKHLHIATGYMPIFSDKYLYYTQSTAEKDIMQSSEYRPMPLPNKYINN